MQDAGCWMLDAGCWMLDAICCAWMLMLDAGGAGRKYGSRASASCILHPASCILLTRRKQVGAPAARRPEAHRRRLRYWTRPRTGREACVVHAVFGHGAIARHGAIAVIARRVAPRAAAGAFALRFHRVLCHARRPNRAAPGSHPQPDHSPGRPGANRATNSNRPSARTARTRAWCAGMSQCSAGRSPPVENCIRRVEGSRRWPTCRYRCR